MTVLTVPRSVGDVLLTRAWPRPDDTHVTLGFEGRDTDGFVRAGTLRLSRDGEVLDTVVAPFGEDPKLPALREIRGELVAHRYGRRAIVRHGDLFVKVVREKQGEELAERNILGAAIAQSAGFLTAAPTLTAPGVLASQALPGRSLQRAEPDGKAWADIWRKWIDLWPQFAGVETDAVGRHTPQDEARVLLEWVHGAIERGVLDDPRGAARKAADRVADQLVGGTPDPAMLSHRDLHDGQFLFDDATGHLGLLDLDTLATAEAALDLGNLAVHAILRVAQGEWRQAQGDVVLHAISEVVETLGVTPARLQLAQSATALRLAAVYAYRPRWQRFAQQWLDVWLTKPVLR